LPQFQDQTIHLRCRPFRYFCGSSILDGDCEVSVSFRHSAYWILLCTRATHCLRGARNARSRVRLCCKVSI
ncbi:hypothetical protein KCV07_g328, partial [Aureobasidium melanogenum]